MSPYAAYAGGGGGGNPKAYRGEGSKKFEKCAYVLYGCPR